MPHIVQKRVMPGDAMPSGKNIQKNGESPVTAGKVERVARASTMSAGGNAGKQGAGKV